jgi:hypothetical protein
MVRKTAILTIVMLVCWGAVLAGEGKEDTFTYTFGAYEPDADEGPSSLVEFFEIPTPPARKIALVENINCSFRILMSPPYLYPLPEVVQAYLCTQDSEHIIMEYEYLSIPTGHTWRNYNTFDLNQNTTWWIPPEADEIRLTVIPEIVVEVDPPNTSWGLQGHCRLSGRYVDISTHDRVNLELVP